MGWGGGGGYQNWSITSDQHYRRIAVLFTALHSLHTQLLKDALVKVWDVSRGLTFALTGNVGIFKKRETSFLSDCICIDSFFLSVSAVSHLHSGVTCILDALPVMLDVSEKITCTGATCGRTNKEIKELGPCSPGLIACTRKLLSVITLLCVNLEII